MKKITLMLSIALLAMFWSACEREIEIDIPNAGGDIVLEGSIEQGQKPIIFLTKSREFFDEFPTDFITFINEFVIQNAEVTISNGSVTETCNFVQDFSQYPFLYYTTTNMVGEIGKNYSVTIKVGDRELSASSFLQTPIPLDSIFFRTNIFDVNEDSLGFLFARLSDPDTIGNAYRMFLKSPNGIAFASGGGLVFNDKFINNTSFDFFTGRPDQPFINDTTNNSFFYKRGDTVYVKFCTIGVKESVFYETLQNSSQNNGNPFAAPIRVISNVKGGLGVFCAYGAAYDTLIITN
jgi:hypothetical protein